MMKNPFQYGGIVSGPYFADRSDEIRELKREMENTNRVFLVSPRRYGKTCLLHQLINILNKEGMACAYIDLNAFPNLRGFAAGLAAMTTRALESSTDRLLKIFSGFSRLRPKLSMDHAGNLNAGLELAVGDKNVVEALIEGLAQAEALAARKKRKLVTIIDEFSDIEKYDGLTLEKALRSEIQKQDHIGYIFSGSEPSMMLAMINDRKRPFYKLGRIMKLGPIKKQTYREFILTWLKKGGYRTNLDDIESIFDIGEDVPYNIQRLCHIMWESAVETKVIDAELIAKLPVMIARQDSAHYEMLWQTATQSQKALLIALAGDPEALPFSKDFQMQHGIGPSSSIKASLVSLEKKGIVCRTVAGKYHFVDRFMPYWIDDIRMAPGIPG
jgi:uncharacterized protein